MPVAPTDRPYAQRSITPTAPQRRRLRSATVLIVIALAATVASVPAAAGPPPATSSWCALSPVDVAGSIVPIPVAQLRAEIDRAAHSTNRSTLDVLLERVQRATLDELDRLPGAGDLEGPSPAEAATDLIDRHDAARALLIAHSWGECRS